LIVRQKKKKPTLSRAKEWRENPTLAFIREIDRSAKKKKLTFSSGKKVAGKPEIGFCPAFNLVSFLQKSDAQFPHCTHTSLYVLP